MWPAAQLCHRAQIPFLGRSQPVETHPEKTFVECGNGFRRRGLDIQACNRAGVCDISCVLAPFLQKIRIAFGVMEDQGHGILIDLDAFVVGWLDDGVGSVGSLQRPDRREVEQALGI